MNNKPHFKYTIPPGYKKMFVRVIYLNQPEFKKLIKTPNGHHFNETGVDNQLIKIATKLEESFPASNFKLVPVAIAKSFYKCPSFTFIEEAKPYENKRNA